MKRVRLDLINTGDDFRRLRQEKVAKLLYAESDDQFRLLLLKTNQNKYLKKHLKNPLYYADILLLSFSLQPWTSSL